jgi:RNA polymerase sigma-70 factor, ECF subfamily
MDDAALVRQALGGEVEAYAELVRRWAARVVALCHARAGRADVAEELALETLLRGFEQLPTLADHGRFGPWLAEIATHACREWLTSKRTTPPNAGEVEGGPRAEAPGAALLREVEALPEDGRTALMLFYYQKGSYRDIARLLEVSAATVNARLTQARTALLRRSQDQASRGPP